MVNSINRIIFQHLFHFKEPALRASRVLSMTCALHGTCPVSALSECGLRIISPLENSSATFITKSAVLQNLPGA